MERQPFQAVSEQRYFVDSPVDQDMLKMAQLVGAAHTLPKPFDRAELLRAVAEALGLVEG